MLKTDYLAAIEDAELDALISDDSFVVRPFAASANRTPAAPTAAAPISILADVTTNVQDRKAGSLTASAKTPRIMVVDDEPINIKVVRKYLQLAGYQDFVSTNDAESAFDLVVQSRPDVVLLDVMMPRVSGLEILQRIRADAHVAATPVIILTASCDTQTRLEALNLGATDFLHKPVDPLELTPRVRNALVVKAHHDKLQGYAAELEAEVAARTADLEEAQQELIHCLAQASEYRDNITGRHIVRVAKYSGVIARSLGLGEPLAQMIEQAAPLHDLGKIGIPDSLLLKPGRLDVEEFELMKRHCSFGLNIMEAGAQGDSSIIQAHTRVGAHVMTVSKSPLLRLAAQIALTHHERWDGKGYPLGLAGEDIPISGRVVAVADVFDALSCKRPYKPAMPLEQCLSIMEEGRSTQFDPQVLDAFFAARQEIVQVQIALADSD